MMMIMGRVPVRGLASPAARIDKIGVTLKKVVCLKISARCEVCCGGGKN
jgi:hypothetical protein